LHDPALESATAQIKTDFDGISAPSMFAEQRRALEEFAKAEDLAVADFGAAQRDEAMLSILRPPSLAERRSGSDMNFAELVRGDLGSVYRPADGSGTWPQAELDLLGSAQARITRFNQQKAYNAAAAAEQAKAFKADAPDDKRPTDCAKVAEPPSGLPSESASLADQQYFVLQGYCSLWRHARDYEDERGSTDQSLASLFAKASGELGSVRKQIKEAQQLQDAEATKSAELQAEVKRLLKAEADAPASTVEQLDQKIAKAAQLLEYAPPAARRVGLEELADTLEAALASELGSEAASPSPALTAQVAAILRLLRASAGTADAYSNRPNIDRASALLIGLAKLRHEAKVADISVRQEQQRLRLLDAQQEALLIRAEQLARAHQVLRDHAPSSASGLADLRSLGGTKGRAASDAIAAYQIAWNAGEIPYRVLQFRVVQVDRSAALEKAEATEADYRALLQPAIDQLAAYGKGGISQEAIVRLLSNLGLAGAILGGE
jgi:hypothetical protein